MITYIFSRCRALPLIPLLFLLLSCFNLFAQAGFYRYDSLPFKKFGNKVSQPFIGGFNAAQFAQIDLDLDGTLDLIIFDREGTTISPFLNLGNRKEINYLYSPEYIPLLPSSNDQYYSADYNCDGKNDIIIGGSDLKVYRNESSIEEGLKFEYVGKIQSMFNPNSSFFTLNPSKPNIIGFGDIEGDGDLDIIAEFSTGNQIEYHRNVSIEQTGNCGLLFERRAICWGDVVESNLNSKLYLDSCRFKEFANGELSSDMKIEADLSKNKNLKHGSSAICVIDLDGNGSQDLLLGDDGTKKVTALYNDDSLPGIKTNAHIFKVDSSFPSYGRPVSLQIFPAAFKLDLNNDSLVDLIFSSNNIDPVVLGKKKDNISYYSKSLTNEKFEYQTNKLFFNDMLDFGKNSSPAFFDYNKDGLVDILIGNYGYYNDSLSKMTGQLALLINTGTLEKPKFDIIDTNFLNLPNDSLIFSNNYNRARQIKPCFADLDSDGDDDLLIGTENGWIHYYEDTSSTGTAKFSLNTPFFQKLNTYQNSAPYLFDVNQDKLFDLIIGNDNGRIEFHENLGDSSKPYFNLLIESIQWQFDTIVRIQIKGTPNLEKLNVGEKIKLEYTNNAHNRGIYEIHAINNISKFIDIIHPFTSSNLDDEINSEGIVNYAIENWGKFSGPGTPYSSISTPFLYTDKENRIKMIVGFGDGSILHVDSITTNREDTFLIIDSSYVYLYGGKSISIAGADLNNDSLLDIILGNSTGGLIAFQHLSNPPLPPEPPSDTIVRYEEFKIYPNPTSKSVKIEAINSGETKYVKIEIFDIKGRLIETLPINQQTLNMTNYSSGLYIFSLVSDKNKRINKKLIKL